MNLAGLRGSDEDGTSSDGAMVEKGLASREAMFMGCDGADHNMHLDVAVVSQLQNTTEQPCPTQLEPPTGLKGHPVLSNIWRFLSQTHLTGHEMDTSDPPDGGFHAWIIVATCHFMAFHTWGFLNAFGVLQTYYVSALSQSPSNISWIGSIQAFFLFFISAFSGRLTDAGYFHQLFAIGSTLQVASFIGVSFARSYVAVLMAHTIMGIGGGLIFIPSVSLVATYFLKNRALALALVVIGNSAGGLFYAAVLQNTLPTIGYPWAMRILGGIVFLTLLPANFLLRPRKIEVKRGPAVEWNAFLEPAYGTFTAGMFCTMVGMWIPVFYLGSFGRDVIHFTPKSSANLILIINGAGLFGRILPTAITPLTGPLNLIVPLTFSTAIVVFTWPLLHTPIATYIFSVFYGIFMAAAQGMLPPSLGSLTQDLSKMGVRLGMVFSVLGFAVLIGNPFAGWLISVTGGSYLWAQIWAAGTLLVGAVLLGVARWFVTGNELYVKV